DAPHRDQHDLVVFLDDAHADHGTVALALTDGPHALAAPLRQPVLLYRRALAVALLGDDEDVGPLTGRVHGYDPVSRLQADADDAAAGPPHGPHVRLGEPHGLPLAGHQQDLVLALGQAHPDQAV